ncbi:MAG: hypothetical protein MAG794_00289 [Gammaproteobacteria bacterium]|nr:hypothetical protein [Gammaproteobacteria bacterium]
MIVSFIDTSFWAIDYSDRIYTTLRYPSMMVAFISAKKRAPISSVRSPHVSQVDGINPNSANQFEPAAGRYILHCIGDDFHLSQRRADQIIVGWISATSDRLHPVTDRRFHQSCVGAARRRPAHTEGQPSRSAFVPGIVDCCHQPDTFLGPRRNAAGRSNGDLLRGTVDHHAAVGPPAG